MKSDETLLLGQLVQDEMIILISYLRGPNFAMRAARMERSRVDCKTVVFFLSVRRRKRNPRAIA